MTKIKSLSKIIANNISILFAYPLLIIIFIFTHKKKSKIIWGTIPIINNKYWSESIKKIGYDSQTLMSDFYHINKKEDFDLYFEDFTPKYLKKLFKKDIVQKLLSFKYILSNASVLNLSFNGAIFQSYYLFKLENYLYRMAGIKIVIIPYGSDAYIYSKVIDPCFRHALLINYPLNAKHEEIISKKFSYYTKYADIVISGVMIDGAGRWDISPCQILAIDTDIWQPKEFYNNFDGSSEEKKVKIIHTPNHRGAKGTEFLIKAVEDLKKEGLFIELILLEKVSNEKVRHYMQEVDILAEQFIATAYALSGIEGMASGLPVMSNLKNETYTRLMRRYSYYNECPILSTQPEDIKNNLRVLIRSPKLRQDLGRAGRKYVEKYHSYETSQYVFGAIYKKILDGQNIDLMNLFHPILSSYNNNKPIINHPLFENNLPEEYTNV